MLGGCNHELGFGFIQLKLVDAHPSFKFFDGSLKFESCHCSIARCVWIELNIKLNIIRIVLDVIGADDVTHWVSVQIENTWAIEQSVAFRHGSQDANLMIPLS